VKSIWHKRSTTHLLSDGASGEIVGRVGVTKNKLFTAHAGLVPLGLYLTVLQAKQAVVNHVVARSPYHETAP